MPLAPIKLTGLVISSHWEGKLLKVLDEFETEFKGETRIKKRIWSVWLDAPCDAQTGESVIVTGDLSTKIGNWDKKNEDGFTTTAVQVIEHHLNNCTIQTNSVSHPLFADTAEDVPF